MRRYLYIYFQAHSYITIIFVERLEGAVQTITTNQPKMMAAKQPPFAESGAFSWIDICQYVPGTPGGWVAGALIGRE